MVKLITGGLGFIGSHLARRLASGGEKVVLFDVTTKTTLIDDITNIEYELIEDEEADYLFKKAVKLEVQSKFDQALKIYKEIVEKYPNSKTAPDAESCIKALQD